MTSLGASAGKPLTGGEGGDGGSGARGAATGGGGGGGVTGAGSATGAGGAAGGKKGAGAITGGVPGMGALNGDAPGAGPATGGAAAAGAAGAAGAPGGPGVNPSAVGAGAAVAGAGVETGGAPVAAAAAGVAPVAGALAAAGLPCISAGLGVFCGCCARAGQAAAAKLNAAAQASLAQLGVGRCESMGVKFAGISLIRLTLSVIGVAKMSFVRHLQTFCNTKSECSDCHSRLDPQSRESWMPDQARHDAGVCHCGLDPQSTVRPHQSPLLLLAQPQQLGAFGIDLDLVLHESVHLVDADADQLEAALGRELLHLGLVVQRRPQVRHALARFRRRRLGHADAAVGAIDPVHPQLPERRHIGQ